jgi:DNA-binding response OmpR family regulator
MTSVLLSQPCHELITDFVIRFRYIQDVMKVLVIDGDRVMADVVAYALQRQGYEVFQAHDGISALERWADVRPDLLILDVNLPRLDGFSVCRRIRKESDTPIIFLSVRCDDADVVQGLELGADAYLGKPFSPRQLVARTQAVLRRAFPPAAPVEWDRGVQLPGYRAFYLEQGKALHLTPLEGRLFELLFNNPGEVQSYEAIMQHVWGSRRGDRDMLRQLVHRLRNKIETDPANRSRIMTIPGRGYTLAETPEPIEQRSPDKL